MATAGTGHHDVEPRQGWRERASELLENVVAGLDRGARGPGSSPEVPSGRAAHDQRRAELHGEDASERAGLDAARRGASVSVEALVALLDEAERKHAEAAADASEVRAEYKALADRLAAAETERDRLQGEHEALSSLHDNVAGQLTRAWGELRAARAELKAAGAGIRRRRRRRRKLG